MTRQRLANLILAMGLVATVGCGSGRTTGFLKKTVTDDSGNTSHYVVYVPGHEVRTTHKLPVILFLNGWGENGEDGLRQISNNFGSEVWRMRGHFPFLAVCPQCSPDGDWTPGSRNAIKALTVLDRAIAEYGGDSGNVCVTGASVGGHGALALAATYPERFTSVVPVASGGYADPERLASIGMPIWSFYNGGDGVAEPARVFRRRLLKAGASPLFTEYARDGHNAWDAAYASPALYHWILQANRSQRTESRFSLLSPDQVLQRAINEPAGERWRSEGELLVTDITSNKQYAEIVLPLQGTNASLHFDVHLAAGDACVLHLSDRNAYPNTESIANLTLQLQETVLHSAHGTDGIGSLPIATQALTMGWNEIRLDIDGYQPRLAVNGWPTLKAPSHSDFHDLTATIALYGSTGKLRYFRVRRQELHD